MPEYNRLVHGGVKLVTEGYGSLLSCVSSEKEVMDYPAHFLHLSKPFTKLFFR